MISVKALLNIKTKLTKFDAIFEHGFVRGDSQSVPQSWYVRMVILMELTMVSCKK